MKCMVMGIVNVTPDSFSDGGKYFKPEEAVRRIHNMFEEGADIVDIGAESTRPGSTPIGWEEEWTRLEPVLRGVSPHLMRGVSPQNLRENLRGHSPQIRPLGGRISIDTYHPETAELALKLGVDMINCVYEEPVEQMFAICVKYGASLVIPANSKFSRGGSAGSVPTSSAGSVPTFLDPMIGFGTTREEDLELLRGIPELAKRGRVLVGASRKRIVKRITGEKVTGKNLGGNLGIAVWCAMNGASIVRVHDVAETVQALKVVEALSSGELDRLSLKND